MRTLSRSVRALCVLGLSSATSSLFAADYVGSAYDGFDYTAGFTADNTLNGGTGWNATGDSEANTAFWGTGANLTASGTRVITNASLTSPVAGSPASTGNALQVTGGSSQIGRALGQTVDSGTFYFSYLTQKTVDQVRTVNFSLFGSNERLAIGQIANNVNTRDPDGTWLAGAGANTGDFVALVSNAANSPAASPADVSSFNGVYIPAAPISYAVDTTFLVVGKVEFDTDGAADTFTLYINPSNLADESSLTPYLVIDHVDVGALTGFRMFAGGTSGAFTASAAIFDEIRFGSTYNDVTGVSPIPEPSSYAALAGLAGLGLAGLRRRRRA